MMTPALLHAGGAWPAVFTWLPAIVLALMAALALTARRKKRRRQGRDLAAVAGLLVIAAATAPPLDEAAESLLTAHMLQHLTLVLVAAPLLSAGRTEALVAGMLPRPLRQRPARAASLLRADRVSAAPVLAWGAFAAGLWAWHAPGLYELAVRDEMAHIVQHATFVVPAWFFWRLVLVDTAAGRLRSPVASVLVFTTMVHSNALAGLLVFAGEPWYGAYGGGSGLTALQDQQLAGAVMWGAGMPAFLGALLWTASRWLREEEATNSDHSVMPRNHVETTG